MMGRRGVFIALALVAATAGVLGAGGGQAQLFPAVSGTFTMRSDPGDWLGQGRSYSFPARAVELGATETTSIGVTEVGVSARVGDSWSVQLSAPEGARLDAGVYADARSSTDAIHPGIRVSGAGRGCSGSTGSFTVLDVEYGPRGYVRSFHATFEYHCEGALPALRGEADVAAAPPPPPLEVDLTFDSSRTSLDRGDSTVRLLGTIACSQAVSAGVSISAEVSEVKEREAAVGSGTLGLPECSPTPTSWLVAATSSNGIPFTGDTLRVTLRGEAIDNWYTEFHGRVVFARDVISNAEANLPSSPHPGFISRNPAWSLVIVLSIVARRRVVTAHRALDPRSCWPPTELGQQS